jgi:type IV pilus assembly protein PilO
MNLKDPKVQKILIGVLGILVVSYVYFGTTLLPITYPVRKAKIQAMEQEYNKLSTELEKARKVVADMARLEAEYERLHEQWLLAQELLPEEEEMPDLLRQVTTAGNKAGVTFALFEPQPVTPREFHAEHPIKVKVRGGYHQVGIFLSRLANLDRIVNVANLQITPPKQQAARGASSRKKGGSEKDRRKLQRLSTETVEAQFTLVAYTLLKGVENEAVQPQHARNN